MLDKMRPNVGLCGKLGKDGFKDCLINHSSPTRNLFPYRFGLVQDFIALQIGAPFIEIDVRDAGDDEDGE